jgi:hypothetical protein
MNHPQPASLSSWHTPTEARPDLNFVVRDLQRTFLRVADNLRWYEQTWLGVPIWQLADTPVVVPSEKYPDAKRSNPRVTSRRFLSERSDFLVVPDYTPTGTSNFPDSVLQKVALEESGNSA